MNAWDRLLEHVREKQTRAVPATVRKGRANHLRMRERAPRPSAPERLDCPPLKRGPLPHDVSATPRYSELFRE